MLPSALANSTAPPGEIANMCRYMHRRGSVLFRGLITVVWHEARGTQCTTTAPPSKEALISLLAYKLSNRWIIDDFEFPTFGCHGFPL